MWRRATDRHDWRDLIKQARAFYLDFYTPKSVDVYKPKCVDAYT